MLLLSFILLSFIIIVIILSLIDYNWNINDSYHNDY